jgi:hypothetical protein
LRLWKQVLFVVRVAAALWLLVQRQLLKRHLRGLLIVITVDGSSCISHNTTDCSCFIHSVFVFTNGKWNVAEFRLVVACCLAAGVKSNLTPHVDSETFTRSNAVTYRELLVTVTLQISFSIVK